MLFPASRESSAGWGVRITSFLAFLSNSMQPETRFIPSASIIMGQIAFSITVSKSFRVSAVTPSPQPIRTALAELKASHNPLTTLSCARMKPLSSAGQGKRVASFADTERAIQAFSVEKTLTSPTPERRAAIVAI